MQECGVTINISVHTKEIIIILIIIRKEVKHNNLINGRIIHYS